MFQNILIGIGLAVNLSVRLLLSDEVIIVDGTVIRGILAQNIKFFREHRKWSQADLAAYSDISIPFLSEIERGNKWPYPDTLAKIVKAFDIKIHELFRESTLTNKKEHDYTVMVAKEMLIAQKEAADSVLKQYLG